MKISKEIKKANDMGIQIAIVVGGGNIFDTGNIRQRFAVFGYLPIIRITVYNIGKLGERTVSVDKSSCSNGIGVSRPSKRIVNLGPDVCRNNENAGEIFNKCRVDFLKVESDLIIS